MQNPRSYRTAGLVVVAAGLVVAVSGHRLAAEPRPYIFGMGHYLAKWADQPWSYDSDVMDLMVDMGATAVWVDFPWAAMESTQGVIDWTYADHQVDTAEAHGLEMFAFVGTTPDWAKLYPNLPGHRTPPAEQYVAAFTNFHAALAARYAGRVKYYQFWNEPSGCGWVNEGCSNGGDCSLFTLWQGRAYAALKAGNPNCVVSAGGFDGDPAGYVQCMYNEGGGWSFDAISIHPYAPGGPGGRGTSGQGIDYNDLTSVHAVMVANGDADKKLWITEYGWNTTDESRRSEDLNEVLTEMKSNEFDYVFYVKYLVLNDWTDFCCYGLVDPYLHPKASYYTFRNFDKTFPQYVDFAADVQVGPAPLSVQFTDQSSITGASAWLWQFGDGATSTDRNPAHVYASEGSYSVRLTVTGTSGALMAEKSKWIRVGHFPSVGFIGGQLPPTTADTQIIEHLRSTGLIVTAYDDEPANRPTAAALAAAHDLIVGSSTLLSANVAGEFRHETVPFVFWEPSLAQNGREALADGAVAIDAQSTLNVLNASHPVMSGISAGTVTVSVAPVAFSYCTGTVASGVQVLAASAGDASRKTMLIAEPGASLLDGGVAAGKRACLFLYDDTWLSLNDVGRRMFDNTIAWALGAPAAAFHATSATQGYAPLSVSFVDESTGAVTQWDWDFGDGQTGGQRSPTHTFAAPGTYDVTLTVDGPGGPSTLVRPAYVTVLPFAPSDFDQDGDVDLADFGFFQVCFNGPNRALPFTSCVAADFDSDDDVDLSDFAEFLTCFNGANRPLACP